MEKSTNSTFSTNDRYRNSSIYNTIIIQLENLLRDKISKININDWLYSISCRHRFYQLSQKPWPIKLNHLELGAK